MFDKDYKKSKEQSINAKATLLEKMKKRQKQKEESKGNSQENDSLLIKGLEKKDEIIRKLKQEKEEIYQEKNTLVREFQEQLRESQEKIERLEQQLEEEKELNKRMETERITQDLSFELDRKTEEQMKYFLSKVIQEETNKSLNRFVAKGNELLSKQSLKWERDSASILTKTQRLEHETLQIKESMQHESKQIQEKMEDLQKNSVETSLAKYSALEEKVHKLESERERHISKLQEYRNGEWFNLKELAPSVLISWLLTLLSPKNTERFSLLPKLVERYNQMFETSPKVDIWEEVRGEILVRGEYVYLVVEEQCYLLQDLNGFEPLQDKDEFLASIQRYSHQVKLLKKLEKLEKIEEILPAKPAPRKRKKEIVKQISQEELENKRKLRKVLQGKKVALISWHNMSSYVIQLSNYGIKTKVLDSKKHPTQVISTLFSEKYDYTYLFIQGVDHPTYWKAMKKYKSYETPPESVRITYNPNPDEIVHDMYISSVGKKKESSLSVLISGLMGNGVKREETEVES
ncbi:hypothetical protein SAMN02745116_01270 [Pilibacter termitis]|uniref:Uncharacterized protein n=1 Tax=Pilibacter termitis TaxID=263852 RepID=A0A1T4N0X5_9ENTE|nr:hypothetical protein [Pilibacter termitis]SJZ72558.1 hypothetical protein SAMN02745116_01270 [Pilibacter termitis]